MHQGHKYTINENINDFEKTLKKKTEPNLGEIQSNYFSTPG